MPTNKTKPASRNLKNVLEDSDKLGDIMGNVIGMLKSVNTNSPEAKLNETTISDGKGGRITLNRNGKDIKK